MIADYGRQRTRLTRLVFRAVQFADGVEDTRPNADGVLPRLISEAGFRDVRETEAVPTATGSISVYVAARERKGSGAEGGDVVVEPVSVCREKGCAELVQRPFDLR